MYRLPDGGRLVRKIILPEPDAEYGGVPDGLDALVDDGSSFRLTDLLELETEMLESEPAPTPIPVRRRDSGLMSEAEGMALIKQYGYPVGKHEYDA